jgi:signal transduction histidine kinase
VSQSQILARHRNGWLELIVSDDGSAGADASSGSRLTVGLVDRVEAIGGMIQIASPPDLGRAINVMLPATRPSDDRLKTP